MKAYTLLLLTLAALLLAPASAQATMVPLAPLSFFDFPPLFQTPEAVATCFGGDFSGDGVSDLVYMSNGLRLSLADGKGDFLPSTTIAMTEWNDSLRGVGDFNGDHHPDLLIATTTAEGLPKGLGVLLGDGHGGFTAAVCTTFADNQMEIVGDMNDDGKDDVVVYLGNGLDSIAVLLSDGTGGFTPGPTASAGVAPRSMAVDDFNGDGDGDVVIAYDNYLQTCEVLLSDGAGGFAAPFVVAQSGISSVAAGDLNGDDHSDLAIGHFDSLGDHWVEVRLGDGAGAFADPAAWPAAGSVALSVCDVDENGRADIVANGGDGSVSVLMGDGSGGLQRSRAFVYGFENQKPVSLGDFNGDGKIDIAVANSFTQDDGTGRIALLIGDGTGRFATPMGIPVANGLSGLAFGDLNEDGIADAVMTNADSEGHIFVACGDLGGGFAPAVEVAAGQRPYRIAIGDMNEDRHLDVVVTNISNDTLDDHPGVSILYGDGGGGLTPGVFISFNTYSGGLAYQALALGDINGNGTKEIVLGTCAVARHPVTDTWPPSIEGSPGDSPLVSVDKIALADFNNDGCLDVVARAAGTIKVWFGEDANGGQFQYSANPPILGGGGVGFDIGDLNGDHNVDVVAGAWLWFGDGTGAFPIDRLHQLDVGPGWVGGDDPIKVGDFNSDGRDDIAFVGGYPGGYEGSLSVLPGDGHGGFGQAAVSAFGAMPLQVVVADTNGDRKPDISGICGSTLITILNNSRPFTINGDAAATTSTGVVLTNDTPSSRQMRFRNFKGVWSDWVTYKPCMKWRVGGGPGLKIVNAQFRDSKGTVTRASDSIVLDTRSPVTRALGGITVYAGNDIDMAFRVHDPRPTVGTVYVTIRIKTAAGKTVQVVHCGMRPVDLEQHQTLTATYIRPGKYRYYVYAVDAAGNHQSSVGSAPLTILQP